MLGRADLSSTLRHYATVTKEVEQKAVDALDKEWRNVAENGSDTTEPY